MTPEIKAAIAREAADFLKKQNFPYRSGNMEIYLQGILEKFIIDSRIEGAEYGYKLAEAKLDIAVKALKHPDIENLDCDCGYYDEIYHTCIGCTIHKALQELGEINSEPDEWREILRQDAENP